MVVSSEDAAPSYRMPVRLYAMLTWTTLRRLPLIHSQAAAFLRRALPEIAGRHGTRVIELGVVRNHVHVVLELPARALRERGSARRLVRSHAYRDAQRSREARDGETPLPGSGSTGAGAKSSR